MSHTTRWIERNRILACVINAYAFTWILAALIIADRYGLGNTPGWLHYVSARRLHYVT